MKRKRLNNATNVADVILDNNILSISAFDQKIDIDLLAKQHETNKITVDVMFNGENLVVDNGDFYVANVNIPAKKYKEIVTGKDEEGNPITELQEMNNIDETEVTLWDLSNIPFNINKTQTNNIGG